MEESSSLTPTTETSGELPQYYKDLFRGCDAPEKNNFNRNFFLGLAGAMVGLGGTYSRNRFLRRPWFAGIQLHVAAAIAGAFTSIQLFERIVFAYRTEDEIMVRHYVMLHPEDFPVPERKKFSEVFLPWVCSR